MVPDLQDVLFQLPLPSALELRSLGSGLLRRLLPSVISSSFVPYKLLCRSSAPCIHWSFYKNECC